MGTIHHYEGSCASIADRNFTQHTLNGYAQETRRQIGVASHPHTPPRVLSYIRRIRRAEWSHHTLQHHRRTQPSLAPRPSPSSNAAHMDRTAYESTPGDASSLHTRTPSHAATQEEQKMIAVLTCIITERLNLAVPECIELLRAPRPANPAEHTRAALEQLQYIQALCIRGIDTLEGKSY